MSEEMCVSHEISPRTASVPGDVRRKNTVIASIARRLAARLWEAVQCLTPAQRNFLRRCLKAGWWAATPWLIPSRLRFIRNRNSAAIAASAHIGVRRQFLDLTRQRLTPRRRGDPSGNLCQSPTFDPSIPFVFMHIPKTSGSAMTSAIIAALQPNRTISPVLDRSLFGTFRRFDTLSPEWQEIIRLDDQSLPRDFDYLSGHLSFSSGWDATANRQLFTILREPVSRVLSHWVYWRGLTCEDLRPWGEWANRVVLARGSLVEFLKNPDLGSQVDNLYVRLLLWPHPLVPDGTFIDPRNDAVLVDTAMDRLRRFAFLDLYENPRLISNIESWLSQPIDYTSVNTTSALPADRQTTLHRELTSEAFDLLEMRTRLDRRLWSAVARARMPGIDAAALRDRTIWRNIARFSLLLCGRSSLF